MLRRSFTITLSLLVFCAMASAQGMDRMDSRGTSTRNKFNTNSRDSLSQGNKGKIIPKGIKLWTVDERFGDIIMAKPDTMSHMFMNQTFTNGLYGEYNNTGNLGAPRINRVFTDRLTDNHAFLFTSPYDFFVKRPSEMLYTNTLSPLTNITYFNCGNRINGEDQLLAKFCVNVNKRLGVGFDLNYLYGRGYYSDQSTSLFNIRLFGTYHGERYQLHLSLSSNAQKEAENGGITNDLFITNPEAFSESYASNEIPTALTNTWNRNKNQHVFLTHRYNLGFYRKVKMTEEEIAAKKFAMESRKDNVKKKNTRKQDEEDDEQPKAMGRPDNARIAGAEPEPEKKEQEGRITMDVNTADSLSRTMPLAADTAWMKREFVPVTSFIHTMQLDNYQRIFQSHRTPTDYYAQDYYAGQTQSTDSIYDKTNHFRLRNTVGVALLEGFNKWVKSGLKLFATSDLRRYTIPASYTTFESTTSHNLSVGAQLAKMEGRLFHYNVTAETWLQGEDLGQVRLDADLDMNFKLLGDTVTLAAKGFFHNDKANYLLRHFHSRYAWWDDDLSKSTHTHLEGKLAYAKTHTALRVAFDELTDYTYLTQTYSYADNLYKDMTLSVKQCNEAITVMTASLSQNFHYKIINWENIITYQKSTKQSVIAVPTLNIYSNLYLKFKIAKVLATELGADVRYFTSYEAPYYSPIIGQYVAQGNADKVKIGNYPLMNVYANFNLKGARFFVMYTHIKTGIGSNLAFSTPHHPTNPSILRIGISWNFHN